METMRIWRTSINNNVTYNLQETIWAKRKSARASINPSLHRTSCFNYDCQLKIQFNISWVFF